MERCHGGHYNEQLKLWIMDLSKLSLTENNYYALSNIFQSLENARTSCSYIENNEELRWELDEMTQRFIKRVEKKVNDNF